MALLGIESCYGFGDCCFNIPLIEAIASKYSCDISVAVKKSCSDAFVNVPCVKEIVHINNLYDGVRYYDSKAIKNFQVTQYVYFNKYMEEDSNHSLAHTSWITGKRVCGVDYDPRPCIHLTNKELSSKNLLDKTIKNVAIESEHYSGQSWCNDDDFERIIVQNPNVKFWWLSLRRPKYEYNNMIFVSSILTRRECIGLIAGCDLFISVGSGFLCAVFGMHEQPKETWVLWIDNYYKYHDTVMPNKWLPDNTNWFRSRTVWNEFEQQI